MHAPTDARSARDLLTHLHRVAVDAAHGAKALLASSHVEASTWHYSGAHALTVALPDRSAAGRVLVVGAGKAAAALAQGLEAVLGDRIDEGVVIVKHGHGAPLQKTRALEAAHPIPDLAGVEATRQLLRLLDTATDRDTVFCLLTGGASSLLVAPAAGLSLQDKVTTSALLLNSGASIHEMNVVRKHLSAVKGGRLRSKVRCRAFCTLAISDVPGDDPGIIGSGPTVHDTSTRADALQIVRRYELLAKLPEAVRDHLQLGCDAERGSVGGGPHWIGSSEYRIVASIGQSIDACRSEAAKLGLQVQLVSAEMSGGTHDAARRFASVLRETAQRIRSGQSPVLLIAGGETTLAVEGAGRGGRNQEFAVVAARELRGIERVAVLAAGTDGTDGPTDAAGAFVDGSFFVRAGALGLSPEDHLRRNDVYPLLDAVGSLYRSGPTGTNVMDLVLGLAY